MSHAQREPQFAQRFTVQKSHMSLPGLLLRNFNEVTIKKRGLGFGADKINHILGI